MATRTITAMFNDRAEAERAGQKLVSELKLDRAMIRTSPEAGATDTGYNQAQPYQETGFFASLKNMFLPDEDRYAYSEGMRRGRVLLSVQVDDSQVDRASDILEHTGALDLDAQEAEWRQGGWTGYDATAHDTMRTAATSGSMAATGATAARTADTGDTIKVIEERLVVGKRMVERGGVRVRAYTVEVPVEERVTLRDETVHLERHPANRAASAADLAGMRDQVIEAREVDEEAVIGKEARVVEEIGIRKDSSDRVETVRDTVRKTQVDVEDTTATTARPAAGTTTGTGMTGAAAGRATAAGAAGTAAGAATGVGAAVDRTLNTNVSGTNPGANAPDGTGGNPPGTMASRAVDKTLGTNISGANPGRK